MLAPVFVQKLGQILFKKKKGNFVNESYASYIRHRPWNFEQCPLYISYIDGNRRSSSTLIFLSPPPPPPQILTMSPVKTFWLMSIWKWSQRIKEYKSTIFPSPWCNRLDHAWQRVGRIPSPKRPASNVSVTKIWALQKQTTTTTTKKIPCIIKSLEGL